MPQSKFTSVFWVSLFLLGAMSLLTVTRGVLHTVEGWKNRKAKKQNTNWLERAMKAPNGCRNPRVLPSGAVGFDCTVNGKSAVYPLVGGFCARPVRCGPVLRCASKTGAKSTVLSAAAPGEASPPKPGRKYEPNCRKASDYRNQCPLCRNVEGTLHCLCAVPGTPVKGKRVFNRNLSNVGRLTAVKLTKVSECKKGTIQLKNGARTEFTCKRQKKK